MRPLNAKQLFGLLILLPLLSACETDRSSGGVLPDVTTYNPAFQAQAAVEISALKPPCAPDVANEHCSSVHRMMIDYLNMRDQTRSIAGVAGR